MGEGQGEAIDEFSPKVKATILSDNLVCWTAPSKHAWVTDFMSPEDRESLPNVQELETQFNELNQNPPNGEDSAVGVTEKPPLSAIRDLLRLLWAYEIPQRPMQGNSVPLLKECIVRIKIGGKVILALIDTGAAQCMMNLESYLTIKPSYKRKSLLTGETLGPRIVFYSNPLKYDTLSPGKSVRAIGTTTLNTSIGTDMIPLQYQVVDGMSVNVILGREFMIKNGILIDYGANTLTLNPMIQRKGNEETVSLLGALTQSMQHEDSTSLSDQIVHIPLMRKNLKPPTPSSLVATVAPISDLSEVFPEEADIDRYKDSRMDTALIVERENVLQDLARTLEYNRSLPIDDSEGVTHPDEKYWEAINKINLEKCTLPQKDQERLLDIIFEQRGAMALDKQVGKLKNFYYTIKMKDDTIFNKDSYRMNFVTREIMQNKIQQLIANDIVIRYMSQYSSPALLVKKPSSRHIKDPHKAEYRLVVDLRDMNEHAVHLQYSLPVIHEAITQLDPLSLIHI